MSRADERCAGAGAGGGAASEQNFHSSPRGARVLVDDVIVGERVELAGAEGSMASGDVLEQLGEPRVVASRDQRAVGLTLPLGTDPGIVPPHRARARETSG